MTYNSSSGKYEATLHLKCTTPNGSYTVEVTATDSGGLTGTNTGTFTVGITCALEIDFSSVDFGAINPGSSSTVTGDDNFSTGDGKPTIKNTGNVNIDVKQSITDNASNPEILFSGNTSSTVEGSTKTLTTTAVSFGISIAPGEATAADYKLSVPAGTMHGNYAGTLTIEPVCYHKPVCSMEKRKEQINFFLFFFLRWKNLGWKKEMEVENEAKRNARDGVDGSSARSILD
ncbi:MAG: hypothetical protein MW690_000373 [Methanophagales archaeon]|nr:hypothetical protein [Methanophagales archaeon]MCU4139811.1 hypothetical protein [Methanophagales archaeon]